MPASHYLSHFLSSFESPIPAASLTYPERRSVSLLQLLFFLSLIEAAYFTLRATIFGCGTSLGLAVNRLIKNYLLSRFLVVFEIAINLDLFGCIRQRDMRFIRLTQ
jgi:hypothetical protein